MRKVFILCVFCCIFLSGCMDKTEAEDRGYVITVGVDMGENERYDISFVTADLSGDGSDIKGKVINVSADSIVEALKKGDSNTNKLLYLGQLKTVVLGESILGDSEGLYEFLSQLENNRDVSIKTIMLGTEKKASEVTKEISEKEFSAGVYIYDFYKNSAEKTAFTEKMELENFISSIRENKSVTVPLIDFNDDDIKIEGAIIVGENGVSRKIEDKDVMSDIWLKNKGEGAVIVNEEGDTLSILDNYCKYKFYEKDGKLFCDINITGRGSTDSLYNGGNTGDLEGYFENVMEEDIESYINLLQKDLKLDPLGFSRKLRKYKNNLYYKYGEDNSFYNMNFNVNCDIKIKSIGMGG